MDVVISKIDRHLISRRAREGDSVKVNDSLSPQTRGDNPETPSQLRAGRHGVTRYVDRFACNKAVG